MADQAVAVIDRPADQAATDDQTAGHIWVGAATVELDLKQARRAVLRGSVRVPAETRVDVLETYCRECRRPFEDVAGEPCIAASFTEHLRGGPIGIRKKRRHDLHRCDLLGCDVPAEAEPQPASQSADGLVRVQWSCRVSDPGRTRGAVWEFGG